MLLSDCQTWIQYDTSDAKRIWNRRSNEGRGPRTYTYLPSRAVQCPPLRLAAEHRYRRGKCLDFASMLKSIAVVTTLDGVSTSGKALRTRRGQLFERTGAREHCSLRMEKRRNPGPSMTWGCCLQLIPNYRVHWPAIWRYVTNVGVGF
jgi:hypothetical protein